MSGAIPTAQRSAAAPPISGRRTRINPAIGRSTSRDQWMFDPGEPMLREVEPALAAEQAADLHHAHIVVGVAEAEEPDLVRPVEDEPGAEQQPEGGDDPLPVPLEQLKSPLGGQLVLALPHFWRSSRWAI